MLLILQTCTRKIFFPVLCLLIISCNSGKNSDNYFYSGDTKIEIRIPGDTFGVLVKESIQGFHASNKQQFDSAQQIVISALQQQGYQPAGKLNERILLFVSNKKSNTNTSREDEARQLADSNSSYISKAGYLSYIKRTNKKIIITDELIISFKPKTTQQQINKVFSDFGLTVKMQNPYFKQEYTVTVNKNSSYDALKISQELKKDPIIEYAQLNHISAVSLNFAPDYNSRQWHIINNMVGGTADADIDADLAWKFTKGDNRIIIGVVDDGFDTGHDDFTGNISGWNFSDNNSDLSGGSHGTPVLGVAAAADNDFGITGSAPNCSYLLGKAVNFMPGPISQAIDYFNIMKARIINISWSYDGSEPVPDNIKAAINRATTADIIIVCALSNLTGNYCTPAFPLFEDIGSLQNVIGVSLSTCTDRYDFRSSGNCLDLLAPSGTEETSRGSLNLVTTDIRGQMGFNDGTRDLCIPENPINADYTECFKGNSAAAPLTAGVAGLILSANPALTSKQARYLLQDCADKIENSEADYSEQNGKSLKETHGYGRLNAYEAVKIASSNSELGGRNGVDIFLRDNKLDWGNTEKPSSYLFEPTREIQPWWKSMDIKVAAPGTTTPTILDNDFFEGLMDNNLIGGQSNKIFVRVRNRGYNHASDVSVKLHWADACLAFPALPADFWSQFPADPVVLSDWHVIGTKTKTSPLTYGGPSVIGTADDNVFIAEFDFTPPLHDETRTRNHYCLMAIIDSPDDPVKSSALLSDPLNLNMDNVTKNYNNATHRNYIIINSEDAGARTQQFIMYNPYKYTILTKPEIKTTGNTAINFTDSSMNKAFFLKPGEKRSVNINLDFTKGNASQEITIQQVAYSAKNKREQIIGGLTYIINSSKKQKPAK